ALLVALVVGHIRGILPAPRVADLAVLPAEQRVLDPSGRQNGHDLVDQRRGPARGLGGRLGGGPRRRLAGRLAGWQRRVEGTDGPIPAVGWRRCPGVASARGRGDVVVGGQPTLGARLVRRALVHLGLEIVRVLVAAPVAPGRQRPVVVGHGGPVGRGRAGRRRLQRQDRRGLAVRRAHRGDRRRLVRRRRQC